jgi:hypothetical protein
MLALVTQGVDHYCLSYTIVWYSQKLYDLIENDGDPDPISLFHCLISDLKAP